MDEGNCSTDHEDASEEDTGYSSHSGDVEGGGGNAGGNSANEGEEDGDEELAIAVEGDRGEGEEVMEEEEGEEDEDEEEDEEFEAYMVEEYDYGDEDFENEWDSMTDEEDEGEDIVATTEEAESGENPDARLLLTDDDHVVFHDVETSIQHHQCCDAITMDGQDADSIICVDGKKASLYSLRDKRVQAVELLRNVPFSVALHKGLFAAGFEEHVAFYKVTEHADGESSAGFAVLATFRVGLSDDGVVCGNMNNGLRFGLCGAQVRLLVANQDRRVYAFNAPQEAGGKGGAAFLCPSLRERGVAEKLEQVSLEGGEVGPTCCIGPFEAALNLAAPSPDGAWLAVVGDCPSAYLLRCEGGYDTGDMIRLDMAGEHSLWGPADGCQYAAWNASSSLLAISSDSRRCVRVFAVSRGGGGAVAGVVEVETREHRLPCLALQFDPLLPDLLFYVERFRRLHAACGVSQQVTLWRLVQNQSLVPDGGGSPAAYMRHCPVGHSSEDTCRSQNCRLVSRWLNMPCTGLLATRKWGLIVALADCVLQEVVQLMLKANREAGRVGVGGGEAQSAGFGMLPEDVMMNIIERAAVPVRNWV